MIKVKKLYPDATMPTQATAGSAGFDLYAYLPGDTKIKTIWPGECVKVGSGVSIQPPEGYFGAIYARSGLATKQGLRPGNCVGVADVDYKGEYIVPLYNDSHRPQDIRHGDRIAQVVFQPYLVDEVVEVDELDASERGAGGFGSTGV